MDNITYDYKTVDATQKNAIEVIDCYEALGWELANKNEGFTSVSLTFKRGRKIKNKDQLNRMQMKLDDHINGIGVLEKRKTLKASTIAIILGVIGALVFGGGMSICLTLPFSNLISYITGSVLALAGALIAFPAYFIFKKINVKDTMKLDVQIDKKRDEISQLCEDAQRLLQQ